MENQQKQKVNFEPQDKKTLVDQEGIKESFITTLMKIHKKSREDAEMIFDKEALYFRKALTDNTKLAACTGISLYSDFLEIAIQRLSIQS